MPEVKITAIIPFYNDYKALQRLLLHLSSVRIPSILCDGRFHQFEKINDSNLSTDGSRFLVTSFKNSKLIQCAPCFIEEKLTMLFRQASNDGFSHAILLGCDEYPKANLELLLNSLKKINSETPLLIKIPFIEHNKNSKVFSGNIGRIFYRLVSITAKSKDIFFYSDSQGQQKEVPLFAQVCKGITIHHDNAIRKKERNDLMKEYQEKILTKK